MKIGLNATCLNNRPSGARQRFIGIYTKLFLLMKDSQFTIYEPIDCNIRDWFESYSNVSFVKTHIYSSYRYARFFQGFFYWRRICKEENFDIFEIYSLPVSWCKSKCLLLTIHDIRGIDFKKNWFAKKINLLIYRLSIYKSNRVITVSHYMENEIKNHFYDAKISVINNGVSMNNSFNKNNYDIENIKLKLPEKFILSVGHLEVRKNYETLIEALSIINLNNIKIHLVIVGNNSGQLESIVKKAKLLGIYRQVHIYNNVSNYDLKLIYMRANLFVFPSVYEGFGIPILEAMKYEVPFVVSDIPVFKEIIGDRGIYFNPLDAKSIADEIMKVVTSKKIANQLIEVGRVRVQKFYFDKISLDLMKIYTEVNLDKKLCAEL
jgi:glycosyltransferase involved in cell wall biosynthesis